MFKAQGFNVQYGSDICADRLNSIGDYILITHIEPWQFLKEKVRNKPLEIIEAKDLSKSYLDSLAERIPTAHIVGLGGGSAMDTAKWVHWRRQLPLTQIPSIPSVDACFTRMSALREEGGVKYEGDAVPELVIVDFELFRSAPAPMITSGIGDILSCHTAWFDWKFAYERGQDEFGWKSTDPEISKTYLRELADCAPGIKAQTDDGLKRLMELHRDVGWRCHELRHARFEEGSEHFFAYTFEEVTGRTIAHGELVSMGVLIMSKFQGNDFEGARSIVESAGTRHRLVDLNVTEDEVLRSIRRTRSFSMEQNHWFSYAQTIDFAAISDKEILACLNW
ncbi:MAG: iron-containing alcohol dehydrogenase [Candidatus Nanopelagicaceae bacterium]